MEQEPVKAIMDVSGVLVIIGALGAVLPPLAALLSIVWFAIRIAESDTFYYMTGWTPKRKDKHDDRNVD